MFKYAVISENPAFKTFLKFNKIITISKVKELIRQAGTYLCYWNIIIDE